MKETRGMWSPFCGLQGYRAHVRFDSMAKRIGRFLRLVFEPANWAWNLIGAGVSGAVGVAAWIRDRPQLGAALVLAGLVLLLLVAGVRLQGRLDSLSSKRGIIDFLGRELTLGRMCFLMLEQACEEYQKALREMEATREFDEEQFSELHRKVGDSVGEWQKRVSSSLRKWLDYSYAARFEDDSGLIPGRPPAKMQNDFCVDRWQHHEMRLQRLHQIIEELQRKWAI
jgi:hypothetical protein